MESPREADAGQQTPPRPEETRNVDKDEKSLEAENRRLKSRIEELEDRCRELELVLAREPDPGGSEAREQARESAQRQTALEYKEILEQAVRALGRQAQALKWQLGEPAESPPPLRARVEPAGARAALRGSTELSRWAASLRPADEAPSGEVRQALEVRRALDALRALALQVLRDPAQCAVRFKPATHEMGPKARIDVLLPNGQWQPAAPNAAARLLLDAVAAHLQSLLAAEQSWGVLSPGELVLVRRLPSLYAAAVARRDLVDDAARLLADDLGRLAAEEARRAEKSG